MIGRAPGDGDRLRKEHRAFTGISIREIHQMAWGEFWIAIRHAFQVRQPIRPGRANEQRLKPRVARGIRRVHRKERQMLARVRAFAFRMKRGQRIAKVGARKAALHPRLKIARQVVEIFPLMGKLRLQRGQRGQRVPGQPRRLMARLLRHAAIAFLKDAQCIDRALEFLPAAGAPARGRRGFATALFFRRFPAGLAKDGLREPIDKIQPELEMIVLADALVSEQHGIRDDRDAARAQRAETDQSRVRRPGLPGSLPGDFCIA